MPMAALPAPRLPLRRLESPLRRNADPGGLPERQVHGALKGCPRHEGATNLPYNPLKRRRKNPL